MGDCKNNKQDEAGASKEDRILSLLESLHERLDNMERSLAVSRPKEAYTTAEAAERLNRAEWTVRNWCCQGQVRGAYKAIGKGRGGEWRIPHDVLVRLQSQGPEKLSRTPC